MFQNGGARQMTPQSRRGSNCVWLHAQITAAKLAAIESDLAERLTIRSRSSTEASTANGTSGSSAPPATKLNPVEMWLRNRRLLLPKENWDQLSENNPHGANATTQQSRNTA